LKKYLSFFIKIVIIFAAWIVFTIALWALLFNCIYTGIILIIYSAGLVFIIILNKYYKLISLGGLILITLILLISYKSSIQEVNGQIRKLAVHHDHQTAFNLKDKFGIYGLNLAMGLAALPVYPEASIETLLLILPAGTNQIRVFHSSFAAQSFLVRDTIKKQTVLLENKTGKAVLKPVRLIWNSSLSYSRFGTGEARVSLALNYAELQIEAEKRKSRWFGKIIISIKVTYPESAKAILLKDPKLIVDEGLFHGLQDSGWLFPYTAVWVYERWL
jgi:hypothetical protein